MTTKNQQGQVYAIPESHPLRKLEARRAEIGQEMADFSRAVKEARDLLDLGPKGPTPPDERQPLMKIRMAKNHDLVDGTNEGERLERELDQARADYKLALEQHNRKFEEAVALVGVNGSEITLRQALNRDMQTVDSLIDSARAEVACRVLPEAEKRYLHAASEFMQAFYILAGLKSTQPGYGNTQALELPRLGVLPHEAFPAYGNSHNQLTSAGRIFREDLNKVCDKLIPLAFHGVLPAEVRLTADPNPRHIQGNPHSPSHDYGVEVIPPDQGQEVAV